MAMKKITLNVILCMILSTATAQDDGKPLPNFTVNVNVLGLLQMGPIIQTEFRAGQSKGYVTPYLRLPYAGLLYQAIASEGFENKVSPAALGLGLQYKVLVPKKIGAWYFSGGVDYSFGATKDDEGLWEGKHSYMAVLANGGYRWRNPNKKTVLNLGLMLGPALALRDNWWYYDYPSIKYDDSQNYFFIMGEFSFGWEK